MINNYSTDQSYNGPQPYKEDGKWYEPIYGTDEDGCHAEVDRVEIDDESLIRCLERDAFVKQTCEDIITTIERIAASEKKAFSEIRSEIRDMQNQLGKVA